MTRKPLQRVVLAIAALSAITCSASAQEVNAYIGFGAANDGSTHQQFNTFGDGTYYPTHAIGGLFGDLGLNVLFGKQLGAGFDIAWRGPQGTYTGIHYRPVFYSFDAIYQPAAFASPRFSPELRVGVGGAGLRFDANDQQNCVNGPACQDSHHFQLHLAVAPRFYVTKHLFVRPAVDIHHVNHFVEFGSDWATQYSVGIGYSLGRE